MIEKIQISDASIAEEIRNNMALVNSNRNGLMPSNGFIARSTISKGEDLNTYSLSGVYMISDNNIEVVNNPGISYGILCVFTPGAYVFQIAVSVTNNMAKFRTRTEASAGWRDWTNL